MKLLIITFLICFSANSKEPKWVNSPQEACAAGHLCAVGEGSGLMTASSNARAEIGKIFSTKVMATTTFSKSADIGEGGAVPAEESYSKQVKESVDELLKGVSISKTFQGEENVYALATLPKAKVGSILKEKMSDLDLENVALFKKKKRSSLFKIQKNLKLRAHYYERFLILAVGRFPSPLTKADLVAMKQLLAKDRPVIYLAIEEIKHRSQLEHQIETKLLEYDYRVIKNPLPKYHVALFGKIGALKEFLKVKGFVKYKFTLELTAKDSKDKRRAALNFQTVQVGRSKVNAYEKAVPALMAFINDNLGNLNID